MWRGCFDGMGEGGGLSVVARFAIIVSISAPRVVDVIGGPAALRNLACLDEVTARTGRNVPDWGGAGGCG